MGSGDTFSCTIKTSPWPFTTTPPTPICVNAYFGSGLGTSCGSHLAVEGRDGHRVSKARRGAYHVSMGGTPRELALAPPLPAAAPSTPPLPHSPGAFHKVP